MTSIRRTKVNWASMRVTSSLWPIKSMKTGMKARCAANLDSSLSTTWRWSFLCHTKKSLLRKRGGERERAIKKVNGRKLEGSEVGRKEPVEVILVFILTTLLPLIQMYLYSGTFTHWFILWRRELWEIMTFHIPGLTDWPVDWRMDGITWSLSKHFRHTNSLHCPSLLIMSHTVCAALTEKEWLQTMISLWWNYHVFKE